MLIWMACDDMEYLNEIKMDVGISSMSGIPVFVSYKIFAPESLPTSKG